MEPLDPELQSLIAAERAEAEPNDADRVRVARSLARRAGAGFAVGAGLLGAPAAKAAAAGAGTALLVKLGAGLALVGSIAVLTEPAWRGRAAPPAATQPVVSAVAPAPLPKLARSAEVVPAPADPAPEHSRVTPLTVDSSVRRVALPPLAEEARLLKQAQQALRDGQAGSALAALSEHQRRFPRGQLSLERSAARIQALCALSRKQEAEREATAFLRQYSGSGLARQVRASCGFSASSP